MIKKCSKSDSWNNFVDGATSIKSFATGRSYEIRGDIMFLLVVWFT